MSLCQIRPGPNLAGFRNSNPAGAGFAENLFSDHRAICRISEKWPDCGFAGAEIRYNPSQDVHIIIR